MTKKPDYKATFTVEIIAVQIPEVDCPVGYTVRVTPVYCNDPWLDQAGIETRLPDVIAEAVRANWWPAEAPVPVNPVGRPKAGEYTPEWIQERQKFMLDCLDALRGMNGRRTKINLARALGRDGLNTQDEIKWLNRKLETYEVTLDALKRLASKVDKK
jgi:hypothetical protein